MNAKKQIAKTALAATALTLALAGCSTDSDVVRHNLSQDAENFKVDRRVVFFNGITDKYLLTIEGKCAIETGESMAAGSLEVTCKLGEDEYKKHFLGLSDNVSFFVEQLEAAQSDEYHYQVMFKPEEIIPDIDFETSVDMEDDGE